jgi:hypothetical protein
VGADVSRKQSIVFVWRLVEITDEHGEVWQTHAMVPVRRYHNVAAQQFDEGHEYVLAEAKERSRASHNYYFAALTKAFDNLPETVAPNFPTMDHFRKYLLIETNYVDLYPFNMESKKEAYRLATYLRVGDAFARLKIRDNIVIVQRAKSQSYKAMGKQEFEESKKKVLELAAQFVQVTPKQLIREGGRGG